MKRLSLLIALLCLMVGTSRALTISGSVLDNSTSAPFANEKVFVFDSLTMWMDSTVTNSSGGYSFTIPTATAISGNFYYLYTRACNKYTASMHPYSSSNITGANLLVNCGSSLFTIHGAVTLSGIANNGLARVYLIRETYDTVVMDTILTAIDSFTTASTGGTYSKSYTTMPSGKLRLKAALLPSHPQYSNYCPTYFASSLVWSGGTVLTSANFNSANVTNINMTSGTNPGGPGFIGGQVLLGAGKNTGVGDPLSSRIILLTNSAGTPLTYTYSDASGQFSFSNLALGTYKLFGDAWGKTNPTLTVTITTTYPSISNITFEENSSSFTGHFGGLGVTTSALSEVSVYPNPATDRVFVKGLGNIGGDKSVILSDVTGSVITHQTFTNGQQVQLSTSALPAGVYMLQLHTEAGSANFRVVK